MDASVIAAFVAAAVALAVGLLGPWVAARSTQAALIEQRRLSNEDRLWHKRAQSYVSLLRWAAEARSLGGSEEELGNPALMRATAINLRIPLELDAELTAYASQPVYALARQFLEGIQASLIANAETLEGASKSGSPGIDAAMARSELTAHWSDDVANRMAQTISDDLHGLIDMDKPASDYQ